MSDKEPSILRRRKIICEIELESQDATLDGLLGHMLQWNLDLNVSSGPKRRVSAFLKIPEPKDDKMIVTNIFEKSNLNQNG